VTGALGGRVAGALADGATAVPGTMDEVTRLIDVVTG